MKTLFSGFYRPTESEFKTRWATCVFSYDANVLLNLYRYPEVARRRFLEVIEALIKRSQLTFQAAFEYQDRRVDQLASNAKAYRDIESILEDALKKVHQYSQRHPFLDRSKVDSALDRAVRQVKDEIKAAQGKHSKNLADADPIHERLGELFEARIGKEPTPDELEKLYKDGEARYQRLIPPGFEDAKKPKEARKYGDLVLWRQLMEIAKQAASPVIFVTDDRKEDWWQIVNGETIGPRPELRQEFKRATGQEVYLYQPGAFLHRAFDVLGIKDDHAIEEIKGVGRKLAAERQSEDRAEHQARSELLERLLGQLLSGGHEQWRDKGQDLVILDPSGDGRAVVVQSKHHWPNLIMHKRHLNSSASELQWSSNLVHDWANIPAANDDAIPRGRPEQEAPGSSSEQQSDISPNKDTTDGTQLKKPDKE